MRRAFISRLAAFPVSAIASFVLTSIMIRGIGSDAYGQVMLISSLFMLLPFADLGTGAVVVNALSEPNRSQEYRREVAAKVFRVLCISAVSVTIVGWLGTFAWSWAHVLGISSEPRAADLATAISISLFALSIPPSMGVRLLIGVGRADLSILIAPLGSVASLGAGWVVLQADVGAIWLSIATPFGLLIAQLISLVIGLRKSGLHAVDLIGPTRFPLREVLSSSVPMLVIMVTLPLALQSHRIIIAHLSTPAELARYSLAMQLYQPMWSFISAAATPLWPRWSSLRDAPTQAASEFRRAIAALAALGLVSIVGTAVLGDPVAGVLSAHTISLGLPLLLAIGSLLTVQALQQAPGMYLTRPRGLRFQAVSAVVATVISVGGSIMLVPSLGALAPPLVTAIGILCGQTLPGLFVVRHSMRSARELDAIGGELS